VHYVNSKYNPAVKTELKTGKSGKADAPDYRVYTERQLLQTLARIDRQRFPERTQEIRQRLGDFDRARLAIAPSGQPFRKISMSPSALRLKLHLYGFPAVALAMAMFALIYREWTDPLIPFAVVVLLCGIYGYAREAKFTLEVFDYGTGLAFRHAGKEAFVELRHIDRVEVTNHEDAKNWIILDLAFASTLGTRIEFYFDAQAPRAPDIETFHQDLSNRMDAARQT
jgi:hypothetical protein